MFHSLIHRKLNTSHYELKDVRGYNLVDILNLKFYPLGYFLFLNHCEVYHKEIEKENLRV
jgi:hypothetical protein